MDFRQACRFIAAAIALVATACTTAKAPSGGPAVVAFERVNVLPMTDAESLLSDQTVLVSGNVITAIGPTHQVQVPAGATRIDGRGRYLMPGLADMHVHLEHVENPAILQLFVAHGVTTVRNMDGRPFILDWRRQAAAGKLAGPTIVTAGPVLDGDPPLRDDNLSVADAIEAESAVAAQADAGYDFIKVYTNLSPEAYRAAVAAARRRGLPIAGHVPRDLSLAEAIASQQSVEHLMDYGDAVDARAADAPWHWSNMFLAMPMDAAKANSLGDRLAAHGVWTVPTLVEADRRIGRPEQVRGWLQSPAMQFVPADAVDYWREESLRAASRMDADDWRLLERGRANRLKLVQILHRSGAPLLAGTDTPNTFLVPGDSLHEELELLVAAGLTSGEALLLATSEAARFLGQADEWGTVVPGKKADLLLLSANPLVDIRNSRRIEGVMLNGRWFARGDLDKMRKAMVSAAE